MLCPLALGKLRLRPRELEVEPRVEDCLGLSRHPPGGYGSRRTRALGARTPRSTPRPRGPLRAHPDAAAGLERSDPAGQVGSAARRRLQRRPFSLTVPAVGWGRGLRLTCRRASLALLANVSLLCLVAGPAAATAPVAGSCAGAVATTERSDRRNRGRQATRRCQLDGVPGTRDRCGGRGAACRPLQRRSTVHLPRRPDDGDDRGGDRHPDLLGAGRVWLLDQLPEPDRAVHR